MLRPIVVVLTALVALLGLTACGSASDTSSTSTPLPTKKIAISVQGTTITPNGDRVDVKIGQPVQFVVTADSAGEIHVHSDPEKELEYTKGTTTLDVGTFDHAGIIEVESHALDKTIVQLQVQ
ncbi:hypothetical protein [Nocardioides sp. Kera G14]|uniref:hypothetical protein n=1 Tax=Nocardioides sp. Kera G14 TaxID=2884264 RepID=UPI001D11940B|nr:hypothetical protein [Nocardioides sp. Kera G14]UDY22822.1 hypothetical protein LH076_12185 [Nocardioides sp. Kera G14]